jgi:hypothetical protein
MAERPGFLQYLAAAFNARPFGMVIPPNWVGLAAVGMLGFAEPGFWVLGAGLELGYLLLLATNGRFQRTVTAAAAPPQTDEDDWTARLGKALLALGEQDRRRYQHVAERCRSIIDLQVRHSATGLVGFEAQQEGLATISVAASKVRPKSCASGSRTGSRRRCRSPTSIRSSFASSSRSS